jgi:putative addiction module component (TIGR02574 family)
VATTISRWEQKMQTSFETIESEALKLNVSERAKLAEHLIASLDEDSEIEEAWAAEVSRRIAEIDSGTVQLIPANEAIASVRAALK